MTDLRHRYPHRLWLLLADFGTSETLHEPAAHDPSISWDAAVDTYADWRAQGWDCWVIGLDLTTDTICDHTAEAHDHLRARLKNRGYELPDWMEDAA
jgi:hypothetical protein